MTYRTQLVRAGHVHIDVQNARSVPTDSYPTHPEEAYAALLVPPLFNRSDVLTHSRRPSFLSHSFPGESRPLPVYVSPVGVLLSRTLIFCVPLEVPILPPVHPLHW